MDNKVDNVKSCFEPRRLGHVNLWVDDIQRAEDFYSQTCGLQVEFTEPDLIASFLGTGHTPHDLGVMETTKGVDRYGKDGLLQLPGTIGLEAGLNHLAWELENEAELVEGWRIAKFQGREIDLTVDHQVAHSVYMFDPDGNYNEFYCDTIKDWRSVLTGPMDLLTTHWDPEAQPPFVEGRYNDDPILKTVETAPLQPKRITHAVVRTAKMEAMLEFYTNVAGLELVKEWSGALYLKSNLTNYDYSLVLVPDSEPSFSHGSFELYSLTALETAIKDLEAANIAIERVVNLPWKQSVFLKDPDGLLSEWYVKTDMPQGPLEETTPLWAQV